MLTAVIVTIVIALLFDFVNGWNDSANAIATIVGSRALSPLKAAILAAIMNFIGAFWSIKIAQTVSKIVISTPETQDWMVIIALAGLIAAMTWAVAMTIIGMPISNSHSLLGGLAGAGIAAGGLGAIKYAAFSKFFWGLVFSPIFGILIGMILIVGISWGCHKVKVQKVRKIFGPLQIISASWMAFTHGTNDAQKVMGVIFMVLVAGEFITPDANMPIWVVVSCATCISLGTALGGWRVIKTLGNDLTDLDTPEGFAAETAASTVLMGTASLGIPVSTTHVITSSVMGVGSAKPSGVKWHLGKKIVLAWLFTLPCTAGLAALIFFTLKYFMQ